MQGRTVVAALAGRADVAAGECHVLGISAGGIFGVLLMAVEPGIGRGVLIFPGGDMPELIATSTESTVVAYREAWAGRGRDAQTLAAEVAARVRSEPIVLARHVDPRRVLLFLSHGDTRVPIRGGLRLERAMGRPETWVLAGDHQTSGICFGFILRETDRFLLGGEQRTGGQTPPPIAAADLEGEPTHEGGGS